MKKIIFLLALVISLSACKNETTETVENVEQSVDSKKDWGTIDESGVAVVDDFNTWWSYHYYEIDLNSNFIPLSSDSTYLKKEKFLNQIVEDQLLPIKTSDEDGISTYRLYPFKGKDSNGVSTTLKGEVKSALFYEKMRFTPFPDVDFTTLEGKNWNTENLLGKFVVYKTWFINCTACIKEFPELNKFVDENKDENVVFLSLATDGAEDLKEFLKTKEFKYQTIAGQEDLIQNQLGLNAYPTHILVNPDGNIVHIFTSANKLIDFVERNGGFKLPPPPPPPA